MYGPKKNQKDSSFPSSSFLTHKVPKCGLKLTTILVLPHTLLPTTLYLFLYTILFLALGSECHIFCLLGVGKSVQDHHTPYTVYAFALVWHILSKGKFNRGKDSNKLLIGTSKTGENGYLIEVTAKYRSVFTIIKGSYFRTLVTTYRGPLNTGLTGLTIEGDTVNTR